MTLFRGAAHIVQFVRYLRRVALARVPLLVAALCIGPIGLCETIRRNSNCSALLRPQARDELASFSYEHFAEVQATKVLATTYRTAPGLILRWHLEKSSLHSDQEYWESIYNPQKWLQQIDLQELTASDASFLGDYHRFTHDIPSDPFVISHNQNRSNIQIKVYTKGINYSPRNTLLNIKQARDTKDLGASFQAEIRTRYLATPRPQLEIFGFLLASAIDQEQAHEYGLLAAALLEHPHVQVAKVWVELPVTWVNKPSSQFARLWVNEPATRSAEMLAMVDLFEAFGFRVSAQRFECQAQRVALFFIRE